MGCGASKQRGARLALGDGSSDEHLCPTEVAARASRNVRDIVWAWETPAPAHEALAPLAQHVLEQAQEEMVVAVCTVALRDSSIEEWVEDVEASRSYFDNFPPIWEPPEFERLLSPTGSDMQLSGCCSNSAWSQLTGARSSGRGASGSTITLSCSFAEVDSLNCECPAARSPSVGPSPEPRPQHGGQHAGGNRVRTRSLPQQPQGSGLPASEDRIDCLMLTSVVL
eukprot:TRINITY_DN55504_c0_g1_i1.p2 TRINITY_DN55504_c0_g1~~TRINITY_DN55504_c0_g1_i1.p2  ORF type:complete len:225 (+),score=68.20 TRINITY_DN55504_c0_g1_i1:96-770(+)